MPVLGPVWAAGVVAASRAGELAGNGVVAVLRPGVAVGTACGVSVGCGACAPRSPPRSRSSSRLLPGRCWLRTGQDAREENRDC